VPRDIRELMAEDNRNRRTAAPAPVKRAVPDEDEPGEDEETDEEEDEEYIRRPSRRPVPAREDYEQPRTKPSLFSKKKKKPRPYDDDEYDDRRGRQIPRKKLITPVGVLVLMVCAGAIVGLLLSLWQYSTAGDQIKLIASIEYMHLQNAMMFFCIAMLALLAGWGK
jgi:hypothetical protein